jgi:hypothetical protein
MSSVCDGSGAGAHLCAPGCKTSILHGENCSRLFVRAKKTCSQTATNGFCTDARVEELRRSAGTQLWTSNAAELAAAWRNLVTANSDVARGYLLHLIARIDFVGDMGHHRGIESLCRDPVAWANFPS